MQEETTCSEGLGKDSGFLLLILLQELFLNLIYLVFCRKFETKVGVQRMAHLPEHCSLVKRWGVIFTCLVRRAFHLEVVSMLDTDSCINAIRRFLCQRGPALSIRTDCGNNFVGAQMELQTAANQLDHNKFYDTLMTQHVKWLFNPPVTAHFWDLCERLIKQVKKILLTMLKQKTLDDEMLHTALCEVESILYDWLITTISIDPNDLEALTPNHLL